MRHKNLKSTTIGIHMRNLRTVVNMAKSPGVINIRDYPFGRQESNKYEIAAPRGIKRALSIEDLERIMRYEPDSNEAWSRDMWLFSFYCNGMNMVDVFKLRWCDVQGDFLYFIREKTKLTARNITPIEVFIVEESWAIIERWTVSGGRSKDDYIFGVFTEDMTAEERHRATRVAVRIINSNMKKIATKLNFEGKISTMVARHTWATILMKNNISMPFISKSLGHTSMTTTERYLGDFDQEQKIEVGKLLSKIGKDDDLED